MKSSVFATLASAIKHPRHLVAVTAVASLTVALLDIRPLEAGLVAEAIYITIAVIKGIGIRVQIAPDNTLDAADASVAEAARGTTRKVPKIIDPPVLPEPASSIDELQPKMHPVRIEQLERLDANMRLIGMRIEDGAPAFGELALSLGRLRDKFVLFARNEIEHETTLRRYSEESLDDDTPSRNAPATGADAFAPSMMALTHAELVPDHSKRASEEMRHLVRELIARYDWQLSEISWQRDQLPSGSEAGKRLEYHAGAILRRRKFADRAATVLNSLHYEMEMIVRKFETVNAEIVTRQPAQIISDINALLLQAEAVTRSLSQLETDGGMTRPHTL